MEKSVLSQEEIVEQNDDGSVTTASKILLIDLKASSINHPYYTLIDEFLAQALTICLKEDGSVSYHGQCDETSTPALAHHQNFAADLARYAAPAVICSAVVAAVVYTFRCTAKKQKTY